MSNEESLDYKKLNLEESAKYYKKAKIEYDPKKKLTEKEFNESISKLITPNKDINSNLKTESDNYIPKESDPYKRMIQLKTELLQNKDNIDKIISQYNDLSSQINISDINNYSLLYSNAQNCKNKIDSFLNYDIIKKGIIKKGYDSDSDSDEEEETEQKKAEKVKQMNIQNQQNQENIMKKREENVKILKQLEENEKIIFKENEKIKSINEKYNFLANNLISKINSIDTDLNSFTKYKICSNPDYSLNILKEKVIDVEKQINNIESIIGDYDFNLHKGTIFGSLNNLLKINNENSKESISNRFQNMREFDGLFSKFTLSEDNVKLMTIYKMLCEGYMIYLSMTKFMDVIHYLKKRINAIKSIILNSEQFDFDMKALNELIKKNETNYETLKKKYYQTLERFSNLEAILKEINNLDVMVKKKI